MKKDFQKWHIRKEELHEREISRKKYSVILSQLKLMSSKRLLRKIRTFPQDDFSKVRKLIKDLI